eukprot:15430260-Alexandrium_andersonii.AAC.1
MDPPRPTTDLALATALRPSRTPARKWYHAQFLSPCGRSVAAAPTMKCCLLELTVRELSQG